MASAEMHPTAASTICLLPTAIPHLPVIPRIQIPKLATQAAIERCQSFGKMMGSAVDECIQVIERAVKTITANNPFVQRLIFLQNQYKTICQDHCKPRRQTNPLSSYNFAAILPGDSVAEMVVTNGILNFLNIYNTLLITRLVLTWFPNSPPVIVNPLSTLCDPYLNIFRGIIPPLGGTLDLSPILAFFVLNALTSTAAALPAELPKDRERTNGSASVATQSSNLTAKQRLWLKRQCSSCEVQNQDDHSD
eukprot:Gb_33767 [translate_table: standard]